MPFFEGLANKIDLTKARLHRAEPERRFRQRRFTIFRSRLFDTDTMPSTSIQKINYNPDTMVLSVWFVASGNRYDYERVPPEIYDRFRNAFVKGRFFNEHIRDHFRFRRVTERT